MRRAMRRPMGVNRTVAIADVRRSGGGLRKRRRAWVRVNIIVFFLLVRVNISVFLLLVREENAIFDTKAVERRVP